MILLHICLQLPRFPLQLNPLKVLETNSSIDVAMLLPPARLEDCLDPIRGQYFKSTEVMREQLRLGESNE